MRALTLWEPWATLIALGAKRYETRGWATPYRGELAVHAANRFSEAQRDIATSEPVITDALCRGLKCRRWEIVRRLRESLGHVIAVVRVVDCEETRSIIPRAQRAEDGAAEMWWEEFKMGDWRPGRHAWRMSRPKRLQQPVPCRGYQRIWSLPYDVEGEVLRQIGRPA